MPQAPAAPKDETSAQRQIRRMGQLEKQRGDLMQLIAANRDYLRLMAQNEELTPAEEDLLDEFYPQKEKGLTRSDDEITRTRKVKAAARAGATTVEEFQRLSTTVAADNGGDDGDE